MKIFFGADYNGEKQADKLKSVLLDFGEVIEPENRKRYLEVAQGVAQEVQNNKGSFGVLICKTGIGMCIVANKFKRIYASRCLSLDDAIDSKIINNANVLCLSAKNSVRKNTKIIKNFFNTEYQGRKIENILDISNFENKLMK